MPQQIITKTQLMQRIAANQIHESFAFENKSYDVTLTRAKMLAENRDTVLVKISDIIPHILANRVIDNQRVRDLTQKQAEDDPALGLVFEEPNGTISHLMIDGSHRALWLWNNAREYQKFWIIPAADAVLSGPDWTEDTRVDWGAAIVNNKIVPRE